LPGMGVEIYCVGRHIGRKDRTETKEKLSIRKEQIAPAPRGASGQFLTRGQPRSNRLSMVLGPRLLVRLALRPSNTAAPHQSHHLPGQRDLRLSRPSGKP
jgi:hypothetical protein